MAAQAEKASEACTPSGQLCCCCWMRLPGELGPGVCHRMRAPPRVPAAL